MSFPILRTLDARFFRCADNPCFDLLPAGELYRSELHSICCFGCVQRYRYVVFETPSFAAILNAAGPLLYAGILSCGIAYTLQVIGQRGIDPAIASMIMCLESVFSVIAGFLLLNQRMTPREILGCGIMFAATVAAQLIPSTQKKNSRN